MTDWDYCLLYAKHGEYSAAAREAGMNLSSFKRRIKHYEAQGVFIDGQPNREAFDQALPYNAAPGPAKGSAPAVRRLDTAPGPVRPIAPPAPVAFTTDEVTALKALAQRQMQARKGDGAMRSGEDKACSFRLDSGVLAAFQAHCQAEGLKLGSTLTDILVDYLSSK